MASENRIEFGTFQLRGTRRRASIIPQLFDRHTRRADPRLGAGMRDGRGGVHGGVEHAATLPERYQLRVFASDIDEHAIVEARLGRYPDSIEVDVSPERIDRFSVRDGSHLRVGAELREMVLFSPHNVLRDPPFSRLDLVWRPPTIRRS